MNWKVLLLFFFTSLSYTGFCQKAEKIHGIAKENKTADWYAEQSDLWQAILKQEADNTEAWLNYYRAERAHLQLTRTDLWPSDQTSFYTLLHPILAKAAQNIPNTFDLYYIQGMTSDKADRLQLFRKANQIDPDRPEVYGELFIEAIAQFDTPESKRLAQKMLEHNIYSNANLQWNRNAMIGLQNNALFITNGDMDCIPKWVLQYSLNIAPEVLVVSKWFLADRADYRRKVFEKMGINAPPKTIGQFESMADYADYLVVYMMQQHPGRTYISAGTPKQFFKDQQIEDQMYLVGNALLYSESDVNNTTIIKKNFEQHYQMEYLFHNFQRHYEDKVVQEEMNLTYLPALFHLKKYYAQQKNWIQEQYCSRLINKIAEDSGRKEQVLSWFN